MARLREEHANEHLPCTIQVAVASKDECDPANTPVSGEQNGPRGGRSLESLILGEFCFLKMDSFS